MLKKVYVDGFVFLPLHIYKRHLSPPVRKMRPIPNPLKILPSFQTKHFKYLYSNKYTLLNLIFDKYLEPRKKLTRFAWSKPLQKCWTVVIFGHLSWFLWTKTIISIFYFKDYYSRNKVEKIICWQITLGATSLTINPSPSKKRKNHQN